MAEAIIRLDVNMLNFSVLRLFLVFILRRIVRVFSSIFAQKWFPFSFGRKISVFPLVLIAFKI